MKLKNKKILIGITGSVAAYKIVLLIRLFIKRGVEVKCVATKSALDFVGGLTISTLSKNPLISDLSIDNDWNNHVALAMWADVFIIAPATLNTLGKAANGICDNMLLATYFSAKCPVFFAPAMDLDMWNHPANQANIQKLISFGNKIIPVGDGELASGLEGEGRMAEPEAIFAFVETKI